MKNLVLKIALKTLAALIIIFIAVFGLASLVAPAFMAHIFESTGHYGFATGYASLAYKYDGSCQNLARCAEDSILSGDNSNIVAFGERLLEDENFGELCLERNQNQTASGGGRFDYAQFISGNVARAKYGLGDKEGALKTALSALNGAFPENNALAALAITAVEEGDSGFMQTLYSEVEKTTPQNAGETLYKQQILLILSGKN